ncbi:DUF4974 domain-containing protein [Echinicola sp. CAU 1574]|uniref:DUF4974 domain-containing protein n=1 Tax=Echinicola arenosa TaxID=2774144 RepID=A0ABR9ANN1_9BACT|nr:FecR family protein [Echinicola arenosa]MBD8489921.1 DUF4974 domain-containing protein [Echinicola arenosa]
MSFVPKTEADFLKHPLFLKWIKSPNEELDRYWTVWCEKHPDKKEMLLAAKELSKSIKWKNQYSISSVDYDRILDDLILFNAKWDHQKKIKRINDDRSLVQVKWWLTAAASVLLIGVLVFNFFHWGQPSKDQRSEITWVSKSASKGVKKKIGLPDGSEVTLNSASILRYPSNFNENRIVQLEGQAFFEVVKNPELPFTVESGKLKTTVLGTSFDVSAYPEDLGFHVAVVTGRVKVATENGMSAIIDPTEATYFDVREMSLTKGAYDYNHLIGWKDRILKFQETPYNNVFDRLSRWYNVDFEFINGTGYDGKYSGEFKNETLENVLKGMEYSLNFNYKIEDGKVIINNK